MGGPNDTALGRIGLAVSGDDVKSRFFSVCARGRRKNAERFFDNGQGIRDLVEGLGLFGNEGRDIGNVGTEDGALFGAEAAKGWGPQGEVVESVRD